MAHTSGTVIPDYFFPSSSSSAAICTELWPEKKKNSPRNFPSRRQSNEGRVSVSFTLRTRCNQTVLSQNVLVIAETVKPETSLKNDFLILKFKAVSVERRSPQTRPQERSDNYRAMLSLFRWFFAIPGWLGLRPGS